MGASLGSILANIIMTECEEVIVYNLVKEGTIKSYVRYVDDTLLLVKRQDIDKVSKAFNGFHKNLKFTVDRFQNKTAHFFDLEICPNGLTIFRKNTPLDSILIWTPLLCGNGKQPGSDHVLVKQRKYVQKKTFQKNSD